jgi:hypothetical protein
MACELVGVGRFELPASSSRTKNDTQASDTEPLATSKFRSQDITSHPTGTPVPDARLTHAPYDVYAKLEDPVGVLSIALGQWEDRDDTKARPEVRRAANKAMDQIDLMLRELHTMRARLVSEMRAYDDATIARVDALLATSRP